MYDPFSKAHSHKETDRYNGSIKQHGQFSMLVWYDYIREMQVYTALKRPTEVEFAAHGSPGDDLSHLQGGEQASAISGHTLEDCTSRSIFVGNTNTRLRV